ncbi:hypothetical protein BA177_06195 [Woeseia oceani]|uniref:Uncharacterized protein n=1 Tax=Woeseia oceani TaxID=1548547 RepID=A0A193LEB7_9GAMM|nr:hypothetical protein BA177_06195 [Woeseia oceani]
MNVCRDSCAYMSFVRNRIECICCGDTCSHWLSAVFAFVSEQVRQFQAKRMNYVECIAPSEAVK